MPYARTIYIDGRDFTNRVSLCRTRWTQNGCDSAVLNLPCTFLDEYMGIEIGQDVDVRWDADTKWWRGVVADLQSRLTGGLTVRCIGTKTHLAGVLPSGRYGQTVETLAPTELDSTGSEDDGNLAAATYAYWISSVDDEGESWTGTKAAGAAGGADSQSRECVTATIAGSTGTVTLTWIAGRGAKKYRVYRGTDVTEADDASVEYVEVRGATVVDNGRLTWTATPYPYTLSSQATSVAPTITDTDVGSVVDYLLDTFLPDTLTKGSVTAGAAVDLDFYDLSKSTGDFQRVLSALADIVGDTIWYVDVDNTVNFVARDDVTSAIALTEYPDPSNQMSSTNLLTEAVRNRTRDGITHLRITGEEDLEDPATAQDASWDTTVPDETAGNIAKLTADHRVHSTDVERTCPTIMPTYAFINGYGSLSAWLADFPNLRWIYLYRDSYSNAFVANYLDKIQHRTRRANLTDALGASYIGPAGPRGRFPVIRAPGIRTSKEAGKVAAEFLLRHVPNPDRWTLTVDNVETLVKPGLGIVEFASQVGDARSLEIVTADYEFGDVSRMVINAGDHVYGPAEPLSETSATPVAPGASQVAMGTTDDISDALDAGTPAPIIPDVEAPVPLADLLETLSETTGIPLGDLDSILTEADLRNLFSGLMVSNYAGIAYDGVLPEDVATSAAIGTASQFSLGDHVHAITQAVIRSAGGAALYVVADAAALGATSGEEDGDFAYQEDIDLPYGQRDGNWVPLAARYLVADAAARAGLSSPVDGDLCYQQDTDILYVRAAAAWDTYVKQVTAANKAGLPASPNGTLGYTTTTNRLYVRAGGVWICISHFET